MTEPAADRPAGKGRRTIAEIDRRTLVVTAVILFGAIAMGVGAIAIFSDPGAPTPAAEGGGTPRIIDRPNQGAEPENPGDRGGWEQLLLLALIVGAVVGIGAIVVRGGGAKARANRERWKAAGATGQDGAVDP